MRRRTALSVGGSLLLVGLAASSLGCLSTRGPAIPLDAEAPDFKLASTSGRDVSLGDLLTAGPAVLIFYRGYW